MARRHDHADATNRTRERMLARRGIARRDGHADDGTVCDAELGCFRCTWGCRYDDGDDLADDFVTPPLTAPLVALALEAA